MRGLIIGSVSVFLKIVGLLVTFLKWALSP
jgi:hypothetical protein